MYLNNLKRKLLFKIRNYRQLKNWLSNGLPAPPPHLVKQKILKRYALDYNLELLVETGTHYGDMIEALKNNFEFIYSIELSKELYLKARRRFLRKKHIKITQGNSAIVLEELVKNIKKPTLFWLDGHYSGGKTAKGDLNTPVLKELTHIFTIERNDYVILIDDARCFDNDPSYPTLEELEKFIYDKRKN
jgi:hypothetical protein